MCCHASLGMSHCAIYFHSSDMSCLEIQYYANSCCGSNQDSFQQKHPVSTDTAAARSRELLLLLAWLVGLKEA